jgi:hypothetical protein
MKRRHQARENALSSATASCKRWRGAERARLHLYRPNKNAAISYKHDSRLQFHCGFAADKNLISASDILERVDSIGRADAK